MLAADLLFAFGDHDDVDRELPPRGEVRLESFHVEEELAFIIDRAARIDLSAAHCRLEWWRCPMIQRLGRLNIVVMVDENGRGSGRVSPLADGDGMTGGWIDLRRYADLVERCLHPFGCPLRVGVVV